MLELIISVVRSQYLNSQISFYFYIIDHEYLIENREGTISILNIQIDPLVAFSCCLLYGWVVVFLTHSPFPFSILQFVLMHLHLQCHNNTHYMISEEQNDQIYFTCEIISFYFTSTNVMNVFCYYICTLHCRSQRLYTC